MKNRIYDARLKRRIPKPELLATFTIPAHALGPDGVVRATYSARYGYGYKIVRQRA